MSGLCPTNTGATYRKYRPIWPEAEAHDRVDAPKGGSCREVNAKIQCRALPWGGGSTFVIVCVATWYGLVFSLSP